jgi:hypothetical protein
MRSSGCCVSTRDADRPKHAPTIRDNVILVMLEYALTKGEQSLAARGRADKVLALRRD